jgi:dCTP diphosphatase
MMGSQYTKRTGFGLCCVYACPPGSRSIKVIAGHLGRHLATMPHLSKGNSDATSGKKRRQTIRGVSAFQTLRSDIRKFAKARDWDKFHSPKNLSMALIAEASELLEHFLWLTEEQSRKIEGLKLEEVEEEIGDVLIYLVRIADQLGIDPLVAARHKLRVNACKYPVKKAWGNATKYTDFGKA